MPKRIKSCIQFDRQHDNRGFVYFIKKFCDPTHLLNSLKVLCKKAGKNRPFLLCVILVAACFVFAPTYGEGVVMYMSTRLRFSWDELQYSMFQTYNSVMTIVGTTFTIVVLSQIYGWHDSLLGILATSSKFAASFVYGFAATGGVFYLGPFVDIFNGSALIAIRSIISKSVEPQEIGKLNSLLGIIEVLMPLIYVPIYMNVYTSTMSTMPGVVFLMGSAFMVPPLLVFIWLFIRHLKANKIQELNNDDSVQSS